MAFYGPPAIVSALDLDLQARAVAAELANDTQWSISDNRVSGAADGVSRQATSPPHPLQVQTLSIEKQERKHSPAPSILRVYQFHYDLQIARVLTIDTQARQVIESKPINSVHLPLNDSEIAFASQQLAADEPLVETLQQEQQRRGQVPFANINELDVKASIYEPLDQSHACAMQRCALMSLFDSTRTVFALEPIVNLQRLQLDVLRAR